MIFSRPAFPMEQDSVPQNKLDALRLRAISLVGPDSFPLSPLSISRRIFRLNAWTRWPPISSCRADAADSRRSVIVRLMTSPFRERQCRRESGALSEVSDDTCFGSHTFVKGCRCRALPQSWSALLGFPPSALRGCRATRLLARSLYRSGSESSPTAYPEGSDPLTRAIVLGEGLCNLLGCSVEAMIDKTRHCRTYIPLSTISRPFKTSPLWIRCLEVFAMSRTATRSHSTRRPAGTQARVSSEVAA